jgi:hypothetical protein
MPGAPARRHGGAGRFLRRRARPFLKAEAWARTRRSVRGGSSCDPDRPSQARPAPQVFSDTPFDYAIRDGGHPDDLCFLVDRGALSNAREPRLCRSQGPSGPSGGATNTANGGCAGAGRRRLVAAHSSLFRLSGLDERLNLHVSAPSRSRRSGRPPADSAVCKIDLGEGRYGRSPRHPAHAISTSAKPFSTERRHAGVAQWQSRSFPSSHDRGFPPLSW